MAATLKREQLALGEAQVPKSLRLSELLQSWRIAAGRRLGRERPLTQSEVAAKVGMSLRWYRDVERGVITRLNTDILRDLADALQLDADERTALGIQSLGGSLTRPAKPDGAEGASELQNLVDQYRSHPAYLCDHAWNVVAYNSCTAEWFPWVTEPQANTMRWVLTSLDARTQLAGWSEHVHSFLAVIRFALIQFPNDRELNELLHAVLGVPEFRRRWDASGCVVASHDGERFQLRLPHIAPDSLDVTMRVLLSGRERGLRLVLVIPVEVQEFADFSAGPSPKKK